MPNETIDRLNTASLTPRQLGYRMPAEWEPHEATWMVWPQNSTDWPGKFAAISWVYADIVRHLSRFEYVHLVVNGAVVESRARSVLAKTGVDLQQITFHQWPTNRGWTRDSGPIFVIRDEPNQERLAITDWRFNAWAKYDDWKLDDTLPGRIAEALALPAWKPCRTQTGHPSKTDGLELPLVLEGGSIDVNGAGCLITTEECLLSSVQQRNPGLGRADLEATFHDYLGIDTVIWLNRGIAGDDTHGHVDDIARFVDPRTIITVMEPDPSDENHELLLENRERLRSAIDGNGRPFRIVELPMPSPVVFRGQRVPASYANFYIANGIVLVPTFNDPKDRVALQILADLFLGREVVGIHSRDLIWGLGALHCMTQQQPS